MMNIKNEPLNIDVDCVGETTGERYYGNFIIKKYLSHKEKNDVARLTESYSMGIKEDVLQKNFMSILAQLNFHIVETNAKWWNSDKGLDLYDEEPCYALLAEIRKLQGGYQKRLAKETEKDEEKKDEEKIEQPA